MSDVDPQIRDSLERLSRSAPAGPGDIWESVVARRRRSRRRRAASVVVPGAAVVALLVLALSPSLDDDNTHVATDTDRTGSVVDGTVPEAGAEPTVTIDASGLGAIRASTSPLRPSQSDASGGWVEHTVTLENSGADTVRLDDYRTGQLLGDREVMVATDGCGYGSFGDQQVTFACRADRRPVTIAPGDSHRFTVTLWRPR